jgi:ribosomal protein L30/L7E
MAKRRTVNSLRLRSNRTAHAKSEKRAKSKATSRKAKDRISKARTVKTGTSSKGFNLLPKPKAGEEMPMQSLGRLDNTVIVPDNPHIELPKERPERLFNLPPERVTSKAQCKALDKAKTDFFIKKTETSLERSARQSKEAIERNDQLNAMSFDSDSRTAEIQKELKWKGKDWLGKDL